MNLSGISGLKLVVPNDFAHDLRLVYSLRLRSSAADAAIPGSPKAMVYYRGVFKQSPGEL